MTPTRTQVKMALSGLGWARLDEPFRRAFGGHNLHRAMSGLAIKPGVSALMVELLEKRGVEFREFEQDDESVRTKMRTRAGKDLEIDSSWLVGCDGASSAVRSAAGIGLLGGTFDEDYLVSDLRIEWGLPETVIVPDEIDPPPIEPVRPEAPAPDPAVERAEAEAARRAAELEAEARAERERAEGRKREEPGFRAAVLHAVALARRGDPEGAIGALESKSEILRWFRADLASTAQIVREAQRFRAAVRERGFHIADFGLDRQGLVVEEVSK